MGWRPRQPSVGFLMRCVACVWGRFTNRPKTNTIAPTGMGSFVNGPYKIIRGGIGIRRWTVEDAGPYDVVTSPVGRVGDGVPRRPFLGF